ncbi:MAG: hypothetical protein JSV69_10655, partial [Chloroflexota bacterium]
MHTILIKRGALGMVILGVLLVVSTAFAATKLLAEVILQGGQRIKLETLADELTAPNFGTSAPGDYERLFVSDQDGILWAID